MGRRNKINAALSRDERVSQYMSNLKLKDLKRACILRGIPFVRVGRYDVNGLQSWLFKNFENKVDPNRLAEFDVFRDQELMSIGAIDDPVPHELRMAFTGEDGEGNPITRKRDTHLLGIKKTDEEVAYFKPRRGSKKSLVFELIRQGKETKEIIKEVQDQYPDAKIGSIKNWCSQARRSEKTRKKLEEDT
jgi:hypothetical protein